MPTLTGFLFGNPVRGPIHVTNWKRPSGNYEFRLTQDFGPTTVDAEPTVKWPGGEGIPAGTYYNFHRGIDLGNTRCGADVIAARAGTVAFAGVDGTGTRVVIINHGSGVRTWYAHLATEVTSVGAKVTEGQKIGTVGSSGNSTACHLHFAVEVSADGVGTYEFVDPWRRLKQNITAHPTKAGVNIRNSATIASGSVYRVTTADDVAKSVKWVGQVHGDTYTVGGKTYNTWEKLLIDGATRYLATPFAWVSQR